MVGIVFIMDFLDEPERESEFMQMYNYYEKTLIGVAMKRVHNIQLAEDCVHEALIKIAKNFSRIDNPVSKETKSYICRIVDNTAIDMYHSEIEKHVNSEDLYEADLWKQSEEIFEKEFEAQELSLMLDTLPDDVKNYLVLHYCHKMTLKEISKTFGISYYLLSKKIKHALNALKGENDE